MSNLYNPAGLLLFAVLALVVCLVMRRLFVALIGERRRRGDAEAALRRSAQLEALATALSKAQTSAEVTHAAITELLHATAAQAGAIAIVTDDEAQLIGVEALGYADVERANRYRVSLTDGTVLAEAVRRRAPLAIGSREEWAACVPDLVVDPVLAEGEGAVALPLLVSGRIIGTVAICFPRTFTPDSQEQPFLVAAAKRIAPAVDRAKVYERAEQARADAEAFRARADRELRERQKAEEALRQSEARYRTLAARTTRLYTLSAGLSEAVTLDAVAKAIVRHGKVVAGASVGSVLLVDGPQFETLYADEYPTQMAEAWHRFDAEPGLCTTEAVASRAPIYIGSFAEWQEQYPRSASMAADGGYASAAVLPLLVEGAAIGVLSFHFTVPVNFDEGYRALLTSVAQHAAQAIDRARLYETAQRARAEAEAANRAKDDFLSIVSHELRTPLGAVLGWASMLRGGTLDPSRAPRAIDAIISSATRQKHLIDELLDVSRIVAGRAPLDPQEIDVVENVRGAVEAVMPQAEAKGVQLCLERMPPALRIVADPRRLEQVFTNLLGNAVKFTPQGGRITVDVIAADGSVDVRVADTGCGIDPAFLPHVFERFRQADDAGMRNAGGLGLCLFIAQRLVDAHRGRIRVESEGEGHGAAFTVTLPAEGRPRAVPRAPSAVPSPPSRR